MSSIKDYFGGMAKWIVKLTHYKGQTKLSIPKSLAGPKGFLGAEYVILDDSLSERIVIRRFVDGESLKDKRRDDSP